MQSLVPDVRYALRTLIKNRGFTLAALLALALGIGANTVIFSIIYAVLIRPLPFPDPDRLMVLFESNPGQHSLQEAVAPANYLDWKAQNSVFESMAAFRHDNVNVSGGDRPERVAGIVATPDLFQVLGVQPLLGGLFRADDNSSNVNTVLISHSFWSRRFGSDPNVVGQKLVIGGQPRSIIGVMPAEFDFPGGVELWTAARFPAPESVLKPGRDPSAERGSEYLDVIGRLRPGVTHEQAQTEMDMIGQRLAQAYPDYNMNRTVNVVDLREQEVGDVRPTLYVLFGAVGFVLLIACANVANLVMARSSARQKEIAIRAALGANRSHIVRQLLTESVVLALVGGWIGTLTALWGMGPLLHLMPSGVHGANDIRIDAAVLLFTISLSLLTGVVFGLLPAFQASRADVNESLKEGGRNSGGSIRGNRIRSGLVVAEISLSLVLLVGAGLLIKSFVRLQEIDPGFETKNLTAMRLNLPDAKYHRGTDQANFFKRLLEEIESRPGVKSVAAISRLPLTPGNSDRSLTIEGRPTNDNPSADYRVVSANYFETVGIPLLRGRCFTERDDAHAPGVAIINDLAAHRIWPDEDPIGKRIQIDGAEDWFEVVGVVGNIRHFGLDAKWRSEVYVPYLKRPWPFMSIVVRGAGGEIRPADLMREAVWSVDKDQPVANLDTMDHLLERSVTGRRFNMLLLAAFAFIALSLAAIGTYGVIAYSVAQRRQELGVRIALGASSMDVLKMVLGQGMKLAVAGVVVGLGGAFLLTRLLASLLFEVSATDPLVFSGIAMLLCAVAAFACYVPALAATRVDPMNALRAE